jgi:polyphosphate kinase 2 (PPK2 family)
VGKKSGKSQKSDKGDEPMASTTSDPVTAKPKKMKHKPYERKMRRLHGELVAMQEWVKSSGAKVCIVFEGRDTAG